MRRAGPGRFLGVPTADTLNTPWEALRRARSSGCRREACAPRSHRRLPSVVHLLYRRRPEHPVDMRRYAYTRSLRQGDFLWVLGGSEDATAAR
jgi:hypothetical protein